MGRAFIFGDNIDTDVLAPGSLMKLPPRELASHCLRAIDADFATTVRPGDYVVAGRNFGLGSSREQAAISLKLLGVSAVLAASFARIFYRNAINVGLPVLVLADAEKIAAGDRLSVDLAAGVVVDHSQNRSWHVVPMPEHLMAMIADGGLIPHLQKKMTAQARPGEET